MNGRSEIGESAAGTHSSSANACTWLFVPGNRRDRFDKARTSAADEIVLDLEDSVPDADKSTARRDVEWWLSHGGSGWVRVNGATSEHYSADVEALAQLRGLRGFVVPKAEVPTALTSLGRRMNGRQIVALVETALGISRAHDIAQSEAVVRLAFGSIDFAEDIDSDESRDALLLARTSLVLASRTASLPPPVDGVTTRIGDDPAVESAARYARSLGFGGKLCIHPSQVGPVAGAFRPAEDQVDWAQRVLRAAAEQTGAFSLDGQMVDEPVLHRARRIVRTAETVPGDVGGDATATP